MWLRADRQSGGRGRSGRAWISPPGNLYASGLIRLQRGDPAPPSLALVAGVALEEVARAYLPADRPPQLKWPNDLLMGTAKLAGILLEREGDAIVAGFGVNLVHHPDIPDRETVSLAALGASAPAPHSFLEELAPAFARWLARWRNDGLPQVRERWLARAHPSGTALSVRTGDGQTLTGLFDGLDESGALRLRLAGGEVRTIQAGDVFLI